MQSILNNGSNNPPGNNVDAVKEIKKLIGQTFGSGEPKLEPLKGDASDRVIYRVLTPGYPSYLVAVYHQNVAENESFLFISEKMRIADIPVPEIFSVNSAKTAYIMEYLGDRTLAEKIDEWKERGQQQKIISAYETVLFYFHRMQQRLPELLREFLRNRYMDRNDFIADLTYFEEDFIGRFGYDALYTDKVRIEMKGLIEQLTALGSESFVYRDFQSRNFMWREERPCFLDYQSAYLGSEYYDLASMLYASQSGLDEHSRDGLIRSYIELSSAPLSFEEYTRYLYLFVLIRRLRSLGAYGFLSMEKGKRRFFQSIYPTLQELLLLFASRPSLGVFVGTKAMIEEIARGFPASIQPPC